VRSDRLSLDRQLSELQRLAESEPAPELFLRLGQLHLRSDDPAGALAAFERGLATTRGVVLDLATGEAQLDQVREELREEASEAQALLQIRDQTQTREALVQRLEAGQLNPAEHDALIRLEVELGLPLHAQTPSCPACQGPLIENPGCEVHSLSCARTGEGGDLCRHMDAVNMFACGDCGQVMRAWLDRRPREVDPHEPLFVRPERTRCPHCQARIADWTQHYNSCSKAPPGHFPRCDVCRQRGYHRRPIQCPRCKGAVGETLCAERRRR